MEELFKIVLTSSLTVLGGISIFVIGQLISKFLIDPVNDLRKVIGETAYALIFYSNIYTSPGNNLPEARIDVSRVLREKASILNSKACMIKWYGLFSFLNLIPERNSITNASGGLIFLSNSVFQGDALENVEKREEIQRLLGIKTS